MPITGGKKKGYEAYCRDCSWSVEKDNHSDAKTLLKDHLRITGHESRYKAVP